MPDDGDDSGISRRQMLAGAAGAAGLVGLAGCTTSEEQERYVASVTEAAQATPPRPPAGTPDNQWWRYVVASMEYQNQQAQAQTQGIAALVEDAGLTQTGDDGS